MQNRYKWETIYVPYIYIWNVYDRSLVDYGEWFNKMIMWPETFTPQAIISRS